MSNLLARLVLSLAFAAALGLIPASIAKSKGRSFGLWWFYGWMLFLVALVHALLLTPDQDATDAIQLAAGGRRCPFCAEIVRPEAIVCRFCGRDLPPVVKEGLPRLEEVGSVGAGEMFALGKKWAIRFDETGEPDARREALDFMNAAYEMDKAVARVGYFDDGFGSLAGDPEFARFLSV